MAPGLTQIKYPTKTTVSSSTAQKMSTQSRTTMYSSSVNNTHVGMLFGNSQRTYGTSYGVTAQRSTTGFEGPDFSWVRDLNASTPALFKQDLAGFDMKTGQCNHNNGMSTLDKLTAGMALLNSILPTISDTVSTVKSTKGSSSAEEDGFNYDTSQFEMTKSLSKADTFGQINQVETKANQKLADFQQNYSKSGADNIKGMNDVLQSVKTGLDTAGVSIDTSKLALSNLKINPDDLSTLDEAAKTINQDMTKIDDFINKDIKAGIDKCVSKSGELQQQIGTLESQLKTAQQAEANGEAANPSSAQIKQQIAELKKQKEEVDNAKKELEGTITKSANDLKLELKKQQDSLGDIKQVKSELADKKYEVAKDNDKEISSNKKKMDKLDSEIKKLETEAKNDSKKAEKLKDKVAEYNGLVSGMNKLNQSLSDMQGEKSFTSSKGKTYTLTNTTIDSKYFEVKSPPAGSGDDIMQKDV